MMTQGEERLVHQVGLWVSVDRNVVDVGQRAAGRFQAKADSLRGEAGPMLDTAEPFFLDRGDQPSVDHDGGRRIAVKSI